MLTKSMLLKIRKYASRSMLVLCIILYCLADMLGVTNMHWLIHVSLILFDITAILITMYVITKAEKMLSEHFNIK